MARSSPLPKLFRGRRLTLFVHLLLNGVCQAVAVITIGWLLTGGLRIENAVVRFDPATALGLLVVAGVLLGLRASERATAERLGQLYVASCRTRLFRTLASMPLRGVTASRFGITMTRLITDLTALKNWVGYGVAQLAVSAMSLIAIAGALFLISPGLAGAAANTIALLVALATAASIWLGFSIRSARRIRGRLAANVGGLMQSPAVARHFRREVKEKKRVRSQSLDLTRALSQWRGIAGLMRALPDAAFPLILVAVGLGITVQTSPLQLDPVALTTSLFLIGLLVSPLRNLILSLEFFMAYREGRRRLVSVMQRHDAGARPRSKKFAEKKGACELQLCGVRGPSGLGPIDARLTAGEVGVVVGESGSGKSTLLQTIAGLIDLEAASSERPTGILLDGFDLGTVAHELWNGRVKLVSPELPLTKGSLRRNISYGGTRIGDEEAWRVLSLCGVDKSNDMLADGLNLRIADAGSNLPSDFRSRVQLARALATQPGLLLLDDPMFLVPGQAQQALKSVLRQIEVTVLIAAPQPCHTIRFDRIWHLGGGRLEDSRFAEWSTKLSLADRLLAGAASDRP